MSTRIRSVVAILRSALDLLDERPYSPRLMAFNGTGKLCNPLTPGCALSLHGAIIAACRDETERDKVFAWTRANLWNIPSPASKEIAKDILEEMARKAEGVGRELVA